ncbi:uncharacterized protein LAESUDRAFT_758355 [Laetiporus sulphureus 93-53]|uniref:Uncharacterized protein n=1 Tax=Laetiporus sulphureus 93-53 TaxID=1314785 RepID=A0A165EUM6_9APHY|nr:uncharacterized protein LAESUDRAFT_758355 [Laetiporus sulphureus 93-53]KZT07796.1 hypothetical protein LAESUDRAFT_758355 [Laetiporus sulphureus 93-53]
MSCSPEAVELAKYIDGPPLAGIFMNTMLYGVMITQTLYYYSTYGRDSKWMKYYVGILFLSDTVNSVFSMWFIYNVLINHFGSLKAVELANWRE